MIGTPRSGNTWLRRVLATAYGFDTEAGRELAVHDPASINWAQLPQRTIVQVHLSLTPRMSGHLAGHGVRVVVPRRHPFDVLISILQYAGRIHDTENWLLGEAGNEAALRAPGIHPGHPTFLDYATGPRARALLAVSPRWSSVSGAIANRYETMVADPAASLERLAAQLGVAPEISWAEALAINSMEELRKTHTRAHMWQGRPGHWRRLLTPEVARTLADAHRAILDEQGDSDQADPELTPELALAHWRSIV